ncbi:MAG: RdgB/HAM1 family non-canonical purine NTP pyrophosphatase [Lachnospiraceae bacterium]|nr:RdgB/HAM1 family non-canonical purine NTP pyrophosphatase [Lachnospiraceae bacterium]
MKIVLATANAHKMREISEIMAEAGFRADFRDMHAAGFAGDIEETGTTFEENALCKARAVHTFLKEQGTLEDAVVLADDSGLVIDALDGEPGIYSARYLGEDTPHSEKNKDILRRMEGVPEEERTARFVCAVAAVFPDGKEEVLRRALEGQIAYESAGTNGFGYDPIFFLPERGCTNAELTPEDKNSISHRGQGFRAMAALLNNH